MVAGRAGRSALGGKVVLQTFMPEHYAIQFASQHDVNGFYLRELEYRKQLGYPPYAKLARLEYRHADPLKAEEESQKTANRLKVRVEATVIKLGKDGALGISKGQRVQLKSIPVNVVDTVGAGDSFDAGFIYGYLNGWEFEKSLRLACVCGALSTQAAGGTTAQPTLEEALGFL